MVLRANSRAQKGVIMSFIATWSPFVLALIALHLLAKASGRVATASNADSVDSAELFDTIEKRVRHASSLF